MDKDKSFSELYSLLEGDSDTVLNVLDKIKEGVTDIKQRYKSQTLERDVADIYSCLRIAYTHLKQLRNNTDQLFKKAVTDEVTGLNRRSYFIELFENCLSRRKDMAYIMTDIDHFDDYNTAYEHQQGDFALRKVADAISDCVTLDGVLGRYGGEEFGIFLLQYDNKNKDSKEAGETIRKNVENLVIPPFSSDIITEICLGGLEKYNLAQKENKVIRNMLLEFYGNNEINSSNYFRKLEDYFGRESILFRELENISICHYIQKFNQGLQKITTSVGVTQYKKGDTLETLIHRADKALLQAKEAGRNIVCVA